MKRLLLIGVPSVIAACLIVWVLSGRNKAKEKTDAYNEEYRYDIVSPELNYSERTVFYVDHGNRLLHMIDTASGKDMIYCNKPNCKHEGQSKKNPNPSCPAAFWGMCYSGAVLHNGHLYFLGNMTEEGVLRTQYLYEMDANGENRRKAVKLEGVERIPYVLYRDHYAVGAYNNSCELSEDGQIISNNKYETGIFVIDLNNDELQMGNKITNGQPIIVGIYYENGSVFYLVVHYGDDVTDEMITEAFEGDFEAFYNEHLEYDFYRYDIARKETVLVKTFKHVTGPQMVDGDVYYFTSDGLFAYDGKSGETKRIPVDNVLGQIHKDKDAVYFIADENNKTEYVYYRMQNGQIEELMRLPRENSFIIAAMCGESVYINYTDDGGNYSFGVLSLDDFCHGKYNVRKLRNNNEE